MTDQLTIVQDPEKIRLFLQLIRQNKDKEAVDFLINNFTDLELNSTVIVNNGIEMNFMDCAAIQGALEVMKVLHERGLSLDRPSVSIFGTTNWAVLNYLLEHNSFIANAQDKDGINPLQNLITHYKYYPENKSKYLESLKLMLLFQSDPHMKGFQGLSAIEQAELLGDSDLMAVLNGDENLRSTLH